MRADFRFRKMIFDLNIRIMTDAWEVESQALGCSVRAAPLCLSTIMRGHETFLAVGEPRSHFENDPDFLSQESAGKLRFFNPFAIGAFEPASAAQVVRFYILKAHRSRRGHLPPWLLEFTQLFLDKCQLVLDIDGYSTQPQTARSAFETSLDHVAMLKTWRTRTAEPTH